jgi:hypothetical protein
VLVVALIASVLIAGCGGSEEPDEAPEVGLLRTAVEQLESTPGLEQECEGSMTALSRDLGGGKIADTATLKSRRAETSACFATVRKQIRVAADPLREILALDGLSEDVTYTPEQVGDMAGPVAAAYTILTISTGLSEQIGRATSLVAEARLGVPLGAGPLHDVLNEGEPVETVNVLLALEKIRKLLRQTVGDARQLVSDSPGGG